MVLKKAREGPRGVQEEDPSSLKPPSHHLWGSQSPEGPKLSIGRKQSPTGKSTRFRVRVPRVCLLSQTQSAVSSDTFLNQPEPQCPRL